MPRALQTILVPLHFDLVEARGLAARHGVPGKHDQGENFWRFRQRNPHDFAPRSFRTFAVPDHTGVKLVYGSLRRLKHHSSKPPRFHVHTADSKEIAWSTLRDAIASAREHKPATVHEVAWKKFGSTWEGTPRTVASVDGTGKVERVRAARVKPGVRFWRFYIEGVPGVKQDISGSERFARAIVRTALRRASGRTRAVLEEVGPGAWTEERWTLERGRWRKGD